MRLSSFIQDTLYEIALGVELARAKAKDLVAINPSSLDGERITEKNYVDFDVSIVVGESEDKKTRGDGRIGGEIQVVSIAKVSAGSGIERETASSVTSQQTHRVSFKVPLYMNANYKNNPAAAEHAATLLNKPT